MLRKARHVLPSPGAGFAGFVSITFRNREGDHDLVSHFGNKWMGLIIDRRKEACLSVVTAAAFLYHLPPLLCACGLFLFLFSLYFFYYVPRLAISSFSLYF